MRLKNLFYLFLIGWFVSCEQPYVGTKDDDDVPVNINPNIFFAIRPLLCQRVNLAVFQGDIKVKTANMINASPLCGQLSLSLPCGTYQIVAVAHNSASNATFSSLEKITFKNNLVTETYLYHGQLKVDSTEQHRTLSFEKVSAKIQVALQDSLPKGAALMKFYYTGGSSTLSANTGFGSVNSRQTVKQNPSPQQEYTIYSFPHAEKDTINLTISVLATDDSVLQEYKIENLLIQKSCLTRVVYNRDGKVLQEKPLKELADEWGTGYDYPY